MGTYGGTYSPERDCAPFRGIPYGAVHPPPARRGPMFVGSALSGFP